jgi:hypothetical protein
MDIVGLSPLVSYNFDGWGLGDIVGVVLGRFWPIFGVMVGVGLGAVVIRRVRAVVYGTPGSRQIRRAGVEAARERWGPGSVEDSGRDSQGGVYGRHGGGI